MGVVADVAASVVTEHPPQVFFPLRQSRYPVFTILVRSNRDAATLSGPIREAIRSVDPDLPLPRVVAAETFVAWATQEQRTGGLVAGGLGFLVLLLSAMGVYGVVGLAVTHRTQEIGVRIAMGRAAARSFAVCSAMPCGWPCPGWWWEGSWRPPQPPCCARLSWG